MDYGELLRSTWRITWRHKYLWILGLFAAEGGGCGFTGGAPGSGDFQGYSFDSSSGADWFAANWAFLAALTLGLFVFGLAMWVISIITTGGLIAGTDAAYGERPDAALGPAWTAGVRSFWRLVGMWVLVALAAFAVVLLLALVIGLPIGLAVARGVEFGAGAIILIVLFVILLMLIAVPVGVILQIVLNWANRSLVLAGTGIIDSLRAGWRLFRSNVGTSLIVWLISVGLSIAAGMLLLVPLVVVGIPIGIVVYRLFTDGGGAMWGILGMLGLLVLVVLAVCKALITTYFAAYWTAAYRNLAPATGAAGYVPVSQLMQTSPTPWGGATTPSAPPQPPPGPVWTNAPQTPPTAQTPQPPPETPNGT